MVDVTFYKKYNIGIPVENPTEDDLETGFQLMDGSEYTGAHLFSDIGILSLTGKANGRFIVRFMNSADAEEMIMGTLLDESKLDDNERLDFYLLNGAVDEIEIYKTVEEKTAKEVARHFFREGELPKGYKWSGNVSKYFA